MEMIIIAIVVMFLAMLGLTHLITGISRWLNRGTDLEQCLLLVDAGCDPETTEARLLQATQAAELLGGRVGIAVLAACGGEPAQIAAAFCRLHQLPMAENWSKLGEVVLENDRLR